MIDDSAAPVPPPSPGGAGAVSAHSPLPDSPVPGRPPLGATERRLYKKRVGDWLSYDRAEEMAYAVKHYWMDRGYMGIETRVVPQAASGKGHVTVWCVRTNMVNGIPPR